MNYEKIYNSLIDRARNRTLEGYSERHHVIPKCLGGSNKKFNIVKLTAEEHYVAHQLLVKMHPENHKLIYAAHMMTVSNPGVHRTQNKMYGWLRKLHASACKARIPNCGFKGKKHSEDTKKRLAEVAHNISDETREKQRKAQLGKKASDDTLDKLRKRKNHTTLHSDETKQKISQKKTGSKMSEETKAKMKEAQRLRRLKEKREV